MSPLRCYAMQPGSNLQKLHVTTKTDAELSCKRR